MKSLRLEVVGSRPYFGTFRSRLEPKTDGIGLGPQRIVLQAHFQRQKFTKLNTANTLSVYAYRSVCMPFTQSLTSEALAVVGQRMLN